MLLWPSYQAEVIFATPPKRGAASPPWLKSMLSPRPKWQMWFYLYILNRVCGGECWESSLKLYKDLADTCWLVELFPFCFFTLGKPSESLLSFTCYCWLRVVQTAQLLWYVSHSIWHRGMHPLHSSFEPVQEDIYKCFPLKVQMLISCVCTAEIIVTVMYHSSVLSKTITSVFIWIIDKSKYMPTGFI